MRKEKDEEEKLNAEEAQTEAAEPVKEEASDKELEELLGDEEEKEEETKEEKVEEAAEEEEEAKAPSKEEKGEEEEEIVEERTYTVPLSKAWIMPPRKRAPRAMRILKAFVTKHMKLEKGAESAEEGEEEEPKRLVISNEVNEKIWSRSIEKPPRKLRVRVAKDKEGNITVYLAEGD